MALRHTSGMSSPPTSPLRRRSPDGFARGYPTHPLGREKAMEAGTVRKDPPAGGDEDARELTGKELVDRAAGGGQPKQGADAVARMSEPEKASALAWFMEDDPADNEPLTSSFSINVAGPDEPERLLNWTIRSLDMDTIDAIRNRARGGSRAQRRAGERGDVNEMQAALGMV